MKTHQQFLEDFSIKGNPTLEIIGTYIGVEKDIEVHCTICKNSFFTTPHVLLKKSGCPICSNKKVIKGVNSFGDEYPQLVKYFIDTNQAYKYSSGSKKKAILCCPICNQKKEIPFFQLKKEGFNCSFCNTMTYPNKFLRVLLPRLKEVSNIEFEKTYQINQTYIRYDGVFNYLDKIYVIEMNGGQHYINCSYNNYNVNKQREKDILKKNFALNNNFIFIDIDCSVSDFSFIKNNIMNSALSLIIEKSDIDWRSISLQLNDCSLLYDICYDYEHNYLQIQELSKKYQLERHNITKILLQGKTLGLCDYPKTRLKNKTNIIVYDKNKNIVGTYPTPAICADELNKKYNLNFLSNSISHVLNGTQHSHRGFSFVRGETIGE